MSIASYRLPGHSVLQRSLIAVAIYGVFYVLLMGALHLGSMPFAEGSATVTPSQAPAAQDAGTPP